MLRSAEPSHGTATITADGKSIVYTPAPGYIGPDTLQYRGKNSASGKTGIATVSIDVVRAPVSGPELPTPVRTVYVPDDYATVAAAVSAAQPGWHIRLRSSLGAQPALSTAKSGTQSNPIVIRADVAPAKSGTDGWTMPKINGVTLTGTDVWLWGIDLGANSVTLGGQRNGLLRCWSHGFNGAVHIFNFQVTGIRCFVINCQISDRTTGANHRWARQSMFPIWARNYFLRINDTLGGTSNGYEALQLLFGKENYADVLGALVEKNLFSRCNAKAGATENENISIKSAGNIVRFNTLINGSRTITNRDGINNQLIANWIETGASGSGMHIYDGIAGSDTRIIGNVVIGGTRGIRVYAGNYQQPNWPSGPPFFPRVNGATIVGNRAAILLGAMDNVSTSAFPATAIRLGANPGSTISRDNVTNVTTVREADYTIPTAVKLTPADVGPGAPWQGWPVR